MYQLVFILIYISVLLSQSSEEIFERYGVDRGLSQSTVSAILQDQHGFIWVGTRNGLNRFDGYNFLTFKYTPNVQKTISDNWINTLYEDTKGRIWVGTLNQGVTSLDPNTGVYQHFMTTGTSGLNSDRVFAITEGVNNTLWIGSENGINKIVNDKIVSFYFDDVLKKFRVNALFYDQNYGLVVGTSSGLFLVNEAEKEMKLLRSSHAADLSSQNIQTIFKSADGALWIGSEQGLYKLASATSATLERYPTQDLRIEEKFILAIAEDLHQNLWIGTLNGLYRFNQETKAVKEFVHRENDRLSLSNNEVRSLFHDKTENLWIGTFGGGGMNKLDLKPHFIQQFHSISGSSETANSGLVRSFLKDRLGNFWVGTNKGVNIYDNVRKQYVVYNPVSTLDKESNDIRVFYEDKAGTMWIGTDGGLGKYLGNGEFKMYRHSEKDSKSLSHNLVFSILEDSKGRFWVGTNGGGLNLMDREKETFTSLKASGIPNSISDDYISFVSEDHDRIIWVGTFSNGLNELIETNGVFSFKTYRKSNSDSTSISSNSILSFYQADDGTRYFGTGGGLNTLNYTTGQFAYYTQEHGLPDNYIYGIQSGGKNDLWISTVNGLSYFNRDSETFRNYGRTDGLINLEYKYNASYKDDNNIIYFGGTNGYTAIHPNDVNATTPKTRVQITDFKVFRSGSLIENFRTVASLKENINMQESLEIPYSENEFIVEFSSVVYTKQANVEYAYKLLGFDKEWHHIGNSNTATFTNIPAGMYTLFIRATDYNKNWSTDQTKLKIRILSPFWHSTWFQLLIATLILYLGFAYYTHRIKIIVRSNRILEEKVDERTRDLENAQKQLVQAEKLSSLGQMVAGITHEVNTPLAYIASNIGLLKEITEEREAELKAALDEPLFNTVVQVLNSSTTGVDKLTSLVRELKDFSRIGSTRFEDSNIKLLIDTALQIAKHRIKKVVVDVKIIDDLTIPCLPNQLNQVFLNLILNSCDAMQGTSEAKSGEKQSELCIEVHKEKDDAIISFTDNGGGISKDVIHRIFDPFFTSKPVGQGVGLGLSISYNIVSAHNGRIDVRSNEGEGTSFIVYLPLVQKIDEDKIKNPYA